MPNNASFISYRRSTSEWVARSVYQDLDANDLDVFLDVESIDSGRFVPVLDAEIRARPYFLPIFSPGALERCTELGDLFRVELETAVATNRRVVPLVTTEFDRGDITRCLVAEVASQYRSFNSVKLDHEYFEAAMEKLRTRFLKPIDVRTEPLSPALVLEAERIKKVAKVGSGAARAALGAQKHFERAFAAVRKDENLVVQEFAIGSNLLKQMRQTPLLMEGFNLQFLALQEAMQRENASLNAVSAVMKSRHEAAGASISKVR